MYYKTSRPVVTLRGINNLVSRDELLLCEHAEVRQGAASKKAFMFAGTYFVPESAAEQARREKDALRSPRGQTPTPDHLPKFTLTTDKVIVLKPRRSRLQTAAVVAVLGMCLVTGVDLGLYLSSLPSVQAWYQRAITPDAMYAAPYCDPRTDEGCQ